MLFDVDIETLEVQGSDGQGFDAKIIGIHRLVSIAAATNIPGGKIGYFCRNSSLPQEEQKVVTEFVHYLNNLYEMYVSLLPSYIENAIDSIDKDLEDMKFSKQKTKLVEIRQYLKKYLRLPVYSFNGGKLRRKHMVWCNLYLSKIRSTMHFSNPGQGTGGHRNGFQSEGCQCDQARSCLFLYFHKEIHAKRRSSFQVTPSKIERCFAN